MGSLPHGMPAELFTGVSGMSLPANSLLGLSPNSLGGSQSIELFQRSSLRPVGGSLPLHLPRSGALVLYLSWVSGVQGKDMVK